MSSQFSDQQREDILREARANIEAAKDFEPRNDLLADLDRIVRPREPEPEIEPERQPPRFVTQPPIIRGAHELFEERPPCRHCKRDVNR